MAQDTTERDLDIEGFIVNKLRVCRDLAISRTSDDVLLLNLEWLRCFLVNARASGVQVNTRVTELVADATNELLQLKLSEEEPVFCIDVHPDRRGLLGRPRLNISPETLQWFVDCGYSAVGIAECLGLHPNTIRQRLNEHQLGRQDRYSSISDEDLDQLVAGVLPACPNTGYKMMIGHLRAMGHTLQQNRVRESMVRSDPEGVINTEHVCDR